MVAALNGEQEFGPRALGHRSLLAYGGTVRIKERMNTLKRREWYRPVAPMVLREHAPQFFEQPVEAPFMSFAPQFNKALSSKFAAAVHLDGSARVQTVTADDSPWLCALLHAVANRTGYGILCNSSFNQHGRPFINSLAAALFVLDSEAELDGIIVDQTWLFQKEAGTPLLEKLGHELGVGSPKK